MMEVRIPSGWTVDGSRRRGIAWSADSEVLRPRVPVDQIESARSDESISVTPEMREKEGPV